jgi:hypothetical protein
MELSLESETPAEEIGRLRREVEHINQQLQVKHLMSVDWRVRALTAEEHCRRLERKYQNLRKRKGIESEADDAEERDVASQSSEGEGI